MELRSDDQIKTTWKEDVKVAENEVSSYPFADKGDMIWSSDSARYIPWEKDPPVVITTQGNENTGLED